MKSTFAFIDKLIILLKYVPPSLTEQNKGKAEKVIFLLNEYTQILRNLISSHKTKKYLAQLKQVHSGKIKNWTQHVTTTLNNMNALLTILDEDTKKLDLILKKKPEEWQPAISNMALGMLMTGLHKEEFEMNEEEKILDGLIKNTIIFEKEELENIINHKTHMQGLNKWNGFTKLSEEKQILEHEKFFARLLS